MSVTAYVVILNVAHMPVIIHNFALGQAPGFAILSKSVALELSPQRRSPYGSSLLMSTWRIGDSCSLFRRAVISPVYWDVFHLDRPPLMGFNEGQDRRSRSDRCLTSCWIRTRSQTESWRTAWDQAEAATQADLAAAGIRLREYLEHILQDCH
jgi:hypothetical protein